MFKTKSGRSFGNAQIGRAIDKEAQMPHEGKAKTSEPSGEGHGMEQPHEHTSETHGTQPHPETGVHAVHVHHMGEGKYVTHTHHDGGHIAVDHHPNEAAMKEHVDQSLPNQGEEAENEPDGDEESPMAGMMGSIGGEDESA